MRIVINEKRKSSKKLYKVAISLIKLSSVLLKLNKKVIYYSIKLNDLGSIKNKILQTYNNVILSTKVNHIIITTKFNIFAQKLNTRRSIKKYVKKRFKIQT